MSSSLATRTISPTAVLSENGLTPRFFVFLRRLLKTEKDPKRRFFVAFCGKSVAKVWPGLLAVACAEHPPDFLGGPPGPFLFGASGFPGALFLRLSGGGAGETPVKLGEKPGEGRFTWALPGFGPIFLQGGQKSLRLCGKIRGRLEKNPGERGERRTFPGPGACVFLMGI